MNIIICLHRERFSSLVVPVLVFSSIFCMQIYLRRCQMFLFWFVFLYVFFTHRSLHITQYFSKRRMYAYICTLWCAFFHMYMLCFQVAAMK